MNTHTPTPWHIYVGGNFIRIGAAGYDEYIKKEHYLGGPLSVADLEYHATKDHSENPKLAQANAAFIVEAVNSYDDRTALLQKCLAYFDGSDGPVCKALFKEIAAALEGKI